MKQQDSASGAIVIRKFNKPHNAAEWLELVMNAIFFLCGILAIGYASLSAVGDTVKTLTVEGVECSEATVLDGTYKVQRPFNFITNDSAELSEAAQAFIDFAVSPDAAELIRLAGAVPLVDAE